MELSHAALQGMLGAAVRPDHQRRQRGGLLAPRNILGREGLAAQLLPLGQPGLRGARGKVTAVCPGFTHTEFHDRMGMDKTVAPRWTWLTRGRWSAEGLADNARGKAVSIPRSATKS